MRTSVARRKKLKEERRTESFALAASQENVVASVILHISLPVKDSALVSGHSLGV